MSQVSSRLPLLHTAKGLACAAIVAHHLACYGPMSDIVQALPPNAYGIDPNDFYLG